MKTFLFLDDTKERHDHFANICHSLPVVVHHAWNVAEAIGLLISPPYDMPYDCVWLDHDLEDTDKDNTGYIVAKYIGAHMHSDMWPKNIVIHSWNPTGAIDMEAILLIHGYKNVKRVPFSFKESNG
ncbi:hypothetical protein UFOVP276_12 [uncultured Caudovirales phage]|uniref:Cyclic-phosphate processing Receiver domain-containing protein n=1 Tax=uncultured Caudovirales phage TaxID=2100421 RepID=A0A6J5LST8_9CAUD|nr:hypothetical protein UFOVP127_149 [uncultured Caudovirales phage]CAB4134789.1 hypothetical protein UFOVP276_12 [uncultured Caudovirales phage]